MCEPIFLLQQPRKIYTSKYQQYVLCSVWSRGSRMCNARIVCRVATPAGHLVNILLFANKRSLNLKRARAWKWYHSCMGQFNGICMLLYTCWALLIELTDYHCECVCCCMVHISRNGHKLCKSASYFVRFCVCILRRWNGLYMCSSLVTD